MSETPLKIDNSIWAEIRMLNSKFQEMVVKLGSLQVEKMDLDQIITDFVEREKKLKEEWIALKKQDVTLRDKLVTTYGEGSLNMESGMFTPTPPPTK